MRVLVCLLVLMSGCAAPEPASVDDSDEPVLDEPVADAIRQQKESFSGTIVYRAAGYDVPTAMTMDGDNHMCISMPPGMRSFNATLRWETPAEMGIDLLGTTRYTTFEGLEDGALMYIEGTQEVTLAVTDRLSGDWFLYAGHGMPGGPAAFTLDLEWTYSGDGEATVAVGDDC